MSIKFRPGRLGKKPDTLTRRWDIYNQTDTSSKTPRQTLFTPEQLGSSPGKISPTLPKLQAVVVMDQARLLTDIRKALELDPEFLKALGSVRTNKDSPWQLRNDGFLYSEDRIYVPDSQDPRLQVVQLKHDHILADHPGQSKTCQLIRRDFYWPNLQDFVTDYVGSCSTCARNKAKRH